MGRLPSGVGPFLAHASRTKQKGRPEWADPSAMEVLLRCEAEKLLVLELFDSELAKLTTKA